MDKIVVEFKMHNDGAGLGVIPNFIDNNTVAFYNRSDKTSIGIISDEFYTPDTLIIFTQAELIERQMLNSVMPQTYIGNTDVSDDKILEDVSNIINTWWVEHMENN